MKYLATKAQRIVETFGAWAVFLMAVLLIFNALSLELYFMLCLLGFLVIAHMSGPSAARPQWRKRIDIVIIAGILIFGLIVAGKVLDILKISLF